MSKVYVPQLPHFYDRERGELYPKYDLTPAEEYGQVVVLLTPSANPFTAMESIKADIYKGLQDMNEDDYLLMVGNPAIMCLTAAIASQYTNGNLRMLQWHGRDKCYNLITAQLR